MRKLLSCTLLLAVLLSMAPLALSAEETTEPYYEEVGVDTLLPEEEPVETTKYQMYRPTTAGAAEGWSFPEDLGTASIPKDLSKAESENDGFKKVLGIFLLVGILCVAGVVVVIVLKQSKGRVKVRCGLCGEVIPDGAQFCPKCGSPKL